MSWVGWLICGRAVISHKAIYSKVKTLLTSLYHERIYVDFDPQQILIAVELRETERSV